MTLVESPKDLLDVLVAQDPQRTCAVHEDRALSYGDLLARVAALSARLGGDFALIVAADPIECVIAWLACYHRGISSAIIDPQTYRQERETLDCAIPYGQIVTDVRIFGRDGAAMVRINPLQRAAWTEPSAARQATLLLLATSRTSGRLKIVRHDNAMLALHHRFWRELCPLQEGDMVAAPREIAFGYGFIVAITWALWSGRAVSFASQTPTRVVVHSKATVSALAIEQLQRAPHLKQLRLAVSSGAMIPNHQWAWFKEAYPGVTLRNLVGATETLTPFLFSDDPASFHAAPHYEARCVDEEGCPVVARPGRLELRGFMTPAYWQAPQDGRGVVHNGWIRLGDFAIDNGDGTYRFLGRHTISLDLENALRAEKGVRDCHVTQIKGRFVVLVAGEGLSAAGIAAIAARYGAQIDASAVAIVPAFQRSPSGKVPADVVEQALATHTAPGARLETAYA